MTAATSTGPGLECDLVMRGGITSGVLYPAAAAAIAADYRLRCIGGTSAGAIAAAGAAAMEYGRRSGNSDALAQLAQIPDELAQGSPTLLSRLFEPDAATAPLFEAMSPLATDGAPPMRRWLALLGVRELLGQTLAVAALAAGIAVLALRLPWPASAGWPWTGWALLALLVALVAGGGFAYARLGRTVRGRASTLAATLRGNGFGLCSGMAGEPSLTGWLHGKLQQLANLPDCKPLTFGHLWRVDGGSDAQRSIELVLIGTDLTQGVSVELPFLSAASSTYIRLSELRLLFPAAVVRWMACHPGTAAAPMDGDVTADPDVVRLPDPADLPVLFAMRISMAHPGIFSAVPLHVRQLRSDGSAELAPRLLSDGGITSNFPVHLFDSPLPCRPTFGLNLIYDGDWLTGAGWSRADEKGGADGVWMPNSNSGRLALFRRFDRGTPLADLKDFLVRVVDTARQATDNAALNAPGYRDRIVHIELGSGEGGAAFDMCSAKIIELADRGRRAGALIAARFLPGVVEHPEGQPLRLNWANHRFVRLRAYLGGLEIAAARFTKAWADDVKRGTVTGGDPAHKHTGIDALVAQSGKSAPDSPGQYVGYDLSKDQRDLVTALVAAVGDVAAASSRGVTMNTDGGKSSGPHPKPTLRLRPGTGRDPRDLARP